MKSIYKAICTEKGTGYYRQGDEISRSCQTKFIDGKITKIYESLKEFEARVCASCICYFEIVEI